MRHQMEHRDLHDPSSGSIAYLSNYHGRPSPGNPSALNSASSESIKRWYPTRTSPSAQKRERLPQAPRAPLPELAEFLVPLRVHFTQGPSAETLRQYLTGLLSEHPNKNCD